MGHSSLDPAFHELQPWNEGRLLGATRALKPQRFGRSASGSIITGVCATERCSIWQSIASFGVATSSKYESATSLPAVTSGTARW